jgi:hypothetical protein
MGASMLGYGEQPYQTKAMKEPGIWPVVALAVEKRYLSLYVSAVIDGEYVAERYASQLGNVSCGKSCIRFSRVDKINLETLKKILVEVNDRYVAGESSSAHDAVRELDDLVQPADRGAVAGVAEGFELVIPSATK